MTTDRTFVFNGDSYNMDNTDFWTKIVGQMEVKKNCYYSWDEGNQAGWSFIWVDPKKGTEANHCLLLIQ